MKNTKRLPAVVHSVVLARTLRVRQVLLISLTAAWAGMRVPAGVLSSRWNFSMYFLPKLLGGGWVAFGAGCMKREVGTSPHLFWGAVILGCGVFTAAFAALANDLGLPPPLGV